MASKTRPCEICKKPIENERLTTFPESRLCLEHVEKIEKHGGERFTRRVLARPSVPQTEASARKRGNNTS